MSALCSILPSLSFVRHFNGKGQVAGHNERSTAIVTRYFQRRMTDHTLVGGSHFIAAWLKRVRHTEGIKQLDDILEGTYPVAAKFAACGSLRGDKEHPRLTEEDQRLDETMHAVLDATISVEAIDLDPLYQATAATAGATTDIDAGNRRAQWKCGLPKRGGERNEGGEDDEMGGRCGEEDEEVEGEREEELLAKKSQETKQFVREVKVAFDALKGDDKAMEDLVAKLNRVGRLLQGRHGEDAVTFNPAGCPSLSRPESMPTEEILERVIKEWIRIIVICDDGYWVIGCPRRLVENTLCRTWHTTSLMARSVVHDLRHDHSERPGHPQQTTPGAHRDHSRLSSLRRSILPAWTSLPPTAYSSTGASTSRSRAPYLWSRLRNPARQSSRHPHAREAGY